MEGEPLEVSPKTPGCSSLDGATAPGPGGGAESEHAVRVGLNQSRMLVAKAWRNGENWVLLINEH